MKRKRGPGAKGVRRRNPAAAAVHSPRFRPKVVGSAKRYRRAAYKRQRPAGGDDGDDGDGTEG